MNNQELFKSFEDDIIYDVHSLRARVSRSQAGKHIIAAGSQILGELARHLKDYKPPTKIEALANQTRHGWGMLLSWICEEHSLDRKGIPQSDFDSWVKWLEDFVQTPT